MTTAQTIKELKAKGYDWNEIETLIRDRNALENLFAKTQEQKEKGFFLYYNTEKQGFFISEQEQTGNGEFYLFAFSVNIDEIIKILYNNKQLGGLI